MIVVDVMGIIVKFSNFSRDRAAYPVDCYSEKVKSVEGESNRVEGTNPQQTYYSRVVIIFSCVYCPRPKRAARSSGLEVSRPSQMLMKERANSSSSMITGA